MFRKTTISIWICLGSFAGFGQQTLDYYLSHAINNSPLVKDLQNQVYSFSIDSQLVRATLRPQVIANSNNMYAPIVKGIGYDEAITNIAQVSAFVSVNKSILSQKSIASQLGSFRIQSQSAANSIRITQQDLKKTITDQYIVTFGEQLQLDLNREVGDLLAKEDAILRTLTQNNVYRQTDYLAFQVTLQQQQLSTAELEVQYKYDLATLNYLAGIRDTIDINYSDTVMHDSPWSNHCIVATCIGFGIGRKIASASRHCRNRRIYCCDAFTANCITNGYKVNKPPERQVACIAQ